MLLGEYIFYVPGYSTRKIYKAYDVALLIVYLFSDAEHYLSLFIYLKVDIILRRDVLQEWSVCEARERGAGLALVLPSGAELERLIQALEHAHRSLTVTPTYTLLPTPRYCLLLATHRTHRQ